MRVRIRLTQGSLVLLAALAACSGGSGGSIAPTSLDCTRPPAPQLLYPVSGATQVPDGNFAMVLGFTTDPAVWGAPRVQTVDGGSSNAATIGDLQSPPSPLPSPMTSPAPQSTLRGAEVGQLLASHTYTVFYVWQPPAACVAPGAGTLPMTLIGHFTTQ